MATYESWTVFALKQELVRRGAVTRGRKKDLIERYANNASEIEALCCGFTAKLSPGGAATPTRALCVCVFVVVLIKRVCEHISSSPSSQITLFNEIDRMYLCAKSTNE